MEMNPVEIFGSHTAWKADERTWFINCMDGSQYMYLLEGDDKALLIDTLYGAGNLRAFVEQLTDKPIEVALTHGHLDHSGGCGEWERVHMLPGAVHDLKSLARGPFDVSKLPHPDYERVLVQDGDTIELGGRSIELLDISAHSNGSLAFLDRAHRMVFVGDELESAQVLMYPIEEDEAHPHNLAQRLRRHRQNMQRLQALEGEYDLVCPNHNGAPISKEYTRDYIELVEHIFAGDATIEDKLNHRFIEMDPVAPTLCRVRWRKACFFVNKQRLMEVYGKQGL